MLYLLLFIKKVTSENLSYFYKKEVLQRHSQPPTVICKMEAQLDTHFIHIFACLTSNWMLSGCLLTKFLHQSSVRSLFKSALLVGLVCFSFSTLTYFALPNLPSPFFDFIAAAAAAAVSNRLFFLLLFSVFLGVFLSPSGGGAAEGLGWVGCYFQPPSLFPSFLVPVDTAR